MKGLRTREQEKWKKLAVFFLLLIVFGVLLNSVRKVYNKKASADQALIRMSKEMEELKSRKDFLEGSLANLETDEGLKFEIRKKLNVAEVGESVAIIVEEDSPAPLPDFQSSILEKVKDFFNNFFE